jgi:cytidylate kinase
MTARNPSAYLAEALAETARPARAPRPGEAGVFPPPAPAFTIALSREVGAGGTSVARELGQRLGWPVYDQEILDGLAQELHVNVGVLERIDERPGSWLQECVEAFGSAASVGETAFFRHLLRMLYSLGARGACVIVGRGAAQVLPAATTLRVRLMARLEDRIALMSRELGLSRPEAARYVDNTDRERIRFIREHFRKDPTDPQHYDLVLNSSRFTAAECAEIILEALRRLEARAAVPS